MDPDSDNTPVDLEITDSIDLHAFHPSEVAAVTRAYLAEAHRAGFPIVRIIHGKGIGVQREIVRKILSETDLVKSFKSGDEFSGGWGATVVQMSTDQRSSITSAQDSSDSGSGESE